MTGIISQPKGNIATFISIEILCLISFIFIEQYKQSIEDLKECLKIQKEYLEPESRLIAETHYQIGLACSFSSRHDEALSEFRLAVKTIESKIGT